MNKAITDVLNDAECGFYSQTKEEFESWLKELLEDKYRPPTTHNHQVAWDVFWVNKSKGVFKDELK